MQASPQHVEENVSPCGEAENVPKPRVEAGVDTQNRVEITPPEPIANRMYSSRSEEERWKEARKIAGGDPEKAKREYEDILSREQMLDAVTWENHEEIDRLKAQRRRRERERAEADGKFAPRRHDALHGLNALPNDDWESADEEVIRDDDESTVSAEKRNPWHAPDDAVGPDDGISDDDADDEMPELAPSVSRISDASEKKKRRGKRRTAKKPKQSAKRSPKKSAPKPSTSAPEPTEFTFPMEMKFDIPPDPKARPSPRTQLREKQAAAEAWLKAQDELSDPPSSSGSE